MMSDTDLHGLNAYMNGYDFDDDEPMTYTPALPAYADVLAALGNPADPLAAVAALRKDSAKKELYQQTVTDVMRLHMELFPEVEYIGGIGALRKLIRELQAENQLYRKLLRDVYDGDGNYGEIAYALQGEHPGEDIVKALATVKAERDWLRDQLNARIEDMHMRIDNILRPVYQAAGTDPQLSEPGDIIRRIQELEGQAEVGALLDEMPLTYSLHFTRTATGNCDLNVWSHDSVGGITGGISLSRATRADALRAAVAAMESDK